MRPDHVGSGGFDSHTFPPPRVRTLLAACCLLPLALGAQQREATRSGAPATAAPPSAAAAAGQGTPQGTRAMTPPPLPPISGRRAFLSSLLLPGLGQAQLDRDVWGSGFFLLEAVGLAMVHRSAEDLRLARAFRADSVPVRWVQDPVTGAPVLGTDGRPRVAEWAVSPYTADLIRSRKLHYEDWIAALVFNHLMSAADAWVAAQLWDLPTQVRLRRVPGGALIGATVSAFR